MNSNISDGDWALWTEESNGTIFRAAIHQAACPHIIKMLEPMTVLSEKYTLTKGLSWTNIVYLHNISPMKFMDSQESSMSIFETTDR